FAPAGKSAASSDFREIFAHIFFGFFHLGSKRQVERLPWNLIDSFNMYHKRLMIHRKLRRDGSSFRRGRAVSSDGNDGSRLDDWRLRLVGDQLAQERNQHDERNTDREAAGAKLREELRVPGVGGDRRGAGRLGNHAREVAGEE